MTRDYIIAVFIFMLLTVAGVYSIRAFRYGDVESVDGVIEESQCVFEDVTATDPGGGAGAAAGTFIGGALFGAPVLGAIIGGGWQEHGPIIRRIQHCRFTAVIDARRFVFSTRSCARACAVLKKDDRETFQRYSKSHEVFWRRVKGSEQP